MKIILDNSQQQEAQEQQQFVIIQSQSLAGKSKIASSEDSQDGQEEIVYMLKDESVTEQPAVIQLDSNCVNQEQFVWIANEQGGDGSSQAPAASTLYTIKELNYAQVRRQTSLKFMNAKHLMMRFSSL